jgi:opacity protein-like surface antigen
MMSFKRAILAFSMLAAVSGAAAAADPNDVPADDYAAMGWYLRGDMGWSWLEWDGRDDNEFTVGGGVGYQYNDYLRADLRVDWTGLFDTTKSADDMTVTTALANMYFDIPTDTMVTPYVGAGAGYGWGTVDGGEDKDGFAYALMAGADVSVTDSVSIDVGYRFREVMSSGNDPMEHQILAGLRYKF